MGFYSYTDDLDDFRSVLCKTYGEYEVSALGAGHSGLLSHSPTEKMQIGVITGRKLSWSRAVGRRPWSTNDFLMIQMDGSSELQQDDRSAKLRAGEMTIMSGQRSASILLPVAGTVAAIHLPSLSCVPPYDRYMSPINSSTAGGRVVSSIATILLDVLHQQDVATFAQMKAALDDYVRRHIERCYEGDNALDWLSQLQEALGAMLVDPRLTPTEMARFMALSERQLYRQFKRHGTTPNIWLWDMRVLIASQALVADRSRSITEVAFSAGFSDSSHFARLFRQKFGQTPREYRVHMASGVGREHHMVGRAN